MPTLPVNDTNHIHERASSDLLKNGLLCATLSCVMDGRSASCFYASPSWSDSAKTTPLKDIVNAMERYPRHSDNASFDVQAAIYMNKRTFIRLRDNTNAADIYGQRPIGGPPLEGVSAINDILRGMNLPQVAIFDEGYLSQKGGLDYFLAHGVALMVDKTFTHIVKMEV